MNLDKDKLESMQVYNYWPELTELNKSLERIENMIDEIQERRMEDKYERNEK